MLQIDGLLLAGGKNSRMGGNYKGNLIYDDETFVEKILNELKKSAEQIWISYGRVQHDSYEGCSIVQDEYPDCGPLGGLHAGMKACEGDVVWVAACDMPFLKHELYQYLMNFLEPCFDGVVPIVDGKLQVLAAIYRPSIAEVLETELKMGNYKLQRVCKKLKIKYIDVSEDEAYRSMLKNINTLEEYNGITGKR